MEHDADAPTVTVGIPYHRNSNPNYLIRSIESIVNQTLEPTELHLIQDGQVSIELATIVKKYLETYSYAKILVIQENKGLPYALNHSILHCRTKYYARMDDDDIAVPERLEKQINYMEKNVDIHILGSWAMEFKEERGVIKPTFLRKVPLEEKRIHRLFHYRNPFVHPSVVFRTEVFSKLGLYNSMYKSSQDLELWARAFKLGIGVANYPEPLVYYHASNVESKRRDLLSVIRFTKALFSYNTLSPYLNLLKIMSVCFRFLPSWMKKLGYQYLRTIKIKENDQLDAKSVTKNLKK